MIQNQTCTPSYCNVIPHSPRQAAGPSLRCPAAPRPAGLTPPRAGGSPLGRAGGPSWLRADQAPHASGGPTRPNPSHCAAPANSSGLAWGSAETGVGAAGRSLRGAAPQSPRRTPARPAGRRALPPVAAPAVRMPGWPSTGRRVALLSPQSRPHAGPSPVAASPAPAWGRAGSCELAWRAGH